MGVVVVLVLLVWWMNMSNTGSYLAPSTNTTTTGTNGKVGTPGTAATKSAILQQINRDVANIDKEIQGASGELSNIGSTPTQVKIVASANHFKSVLYLMTSIRVELEAAISNTSNPVTTSPVNAKFADMDMQISNATSDVGVVINNTSKISPSATTANNTTLSQSLTQLKASQTYIQKARADIGTVVSGLH